MLYENTLKRVKLIAVKILLIDISILGLNILNVSFTNRQPTTRPSLLTELMYAVHSSPNPMHCGHSTAWWSFIEYFIMAGRDPWSNLSKPYVRMRNQVTIIINSCEFSTSLMSLVSSSLIFSDSVILSSCTSRDSFFKAF